MDLAYFRPVSLTSCVGILYEELINQQLQWWLESSDVLPEQFAGFRQERCTMNCIWDMTSVEHARTQGRTTVAVFLDITRTYDTVNQAHIVYYETGLENEF